MYVPLSNWRYDFVDTSSSDSLFSTVYKSESIAGSAQNPHTLGSGPNHEGYVVVTFPEETPVGVSYFSSGRWVLLL